MREATVGRDHATDDDAATRSAPASASVDAALWKVAPLVNVSSSFAQRFTATFSEDRRTIAGSWEISQDGETWEKDFDLTYVRAG